MESPTPQISSPVSSPALTSTSVLPEAEDQPSPLPSRHSKYYFDDEMAVFLVEDKLFKVHQHFLAQESQIFRWMFMCSPRLGPDGTTDDCPIPLPGVKSCEFERLLDFFYDGMYRLPHSPLSPGKSAQSNKEEYLEQWVDLLSISTQCDFEKVRERAINAIEGKLELDPIKQICLAEKYNIPRWLAPAFASLCQRVNPLEVHEAEKIGIRNAVMVAKVREAVREAVRESAVDRPSSPHPSSPFGSPPSSPIIPLMTRPPGPPYSKPLVARVVKEVLSPLPAKLLQPVELKQGGRKKLPPPIDSESKQSGKKKKKKK